MKTKGRFIGILAVLSLLIAMLPMGSVGAAVAGTAALTGGVVVGSGTTAVTYYSDKTGFNIVTATVTDTDLSPIRSTSARFQNATASKVAFVLPVTAANVSSAIIAGEATKTETFSAVAGDQTFTLATATGGAADRPLSGVYNGILDAADVVVKIAGVTTAHTVVIGATNKITTVSVLAAANTATITNGVTIEYNYTDYTATALNIPGSSVSVFFGAGVNNENTQILDILSVDSTTGTITVGAAPAIANTNEVLVNFSFEVQDVKTKLFTVSTPTSVSLGKSRVLTGTETGVATDAYSNSVALFSAADLGKIETEAADTANDLADPNGGDGDTIVQIDELNRTAGLATAGYDANGSVFLTRLIAAAEALGLDVDVDKASTLIARLLPITDAEAITVTYVDSSPSGTITNTRSAIADLGAPVVTLQTPSHKLYTSVGTQQMLAKVSDAGSGLASASVNLVAPTGAAGTAVISLNTAGGYDASLSPTSALAEGPKTWFIAVKDRVGNVPVTEDVSVAGNQAALGAAPHGVTAHGDAGQKFEFTVDTSGPTASSAATGFYVKNPGVLTGAGVEVEKGDNRSYVRYVFDLGTGGAPIDAATVSVNDFTVAGAVPVSAIVNAVAQGSNAAGSTVYLEVGEQATNAKPSVVLTGSISDKAGNVRTSGTKVAADKLSPVLTVVPDLAYSEKTTVITITSSETLGVPPALITRASVPTCTNPTTTGSPATQVVQSVGLTSWTSTFTNPASGNSKQWVVATGTDAGGNATIFGDACIATVATAADVVVFQVDDAAPVQRFPAATATSTEGDVWIVVRYDENEYTGDTHKSVTVKSATLNGVDVSSEIFVGEVKELVNTSDTANLATASDPHATVTLAKNLAVGVHKFVIVVQDDATNASSTFTHTLTVTAKTKTSIVLSPGVNLISIPGTPVGDGGNLNTLLTGLPVTSVVSYDRTLEAAGANPWLTSTKDAETGLFTGDITVIEPGKSYFVTATARATIKVLIEAATMVLPPTIQVQQGWNSIGYWSISGAASVDLDSYLSSVKWNVAYSYDPTPGVGWTILRAGTADTASNGVGMLLYVTADGTLTP